MNQAIALSLLALASFSDLHRQRVSNVLILLFLLLGSIRVVCCGLPAFYQLSLLVVLAMSILWYHHLLGAADVKVCFVLALLLPADEWLKALLLCCVISLIWLYLHRPRKRMPMLPALFVSLSWVLLC